MVVIFVLATIVFFIAMDVIYLRVTARKPASAAEPRADSLQTMRMPRVPGGIFVSPQHSWVCVSPNGRVTVGADDFIRSAIGEIDEIQLPEMGAALKKGEPLAVLKRGDQSVRILSPVTGEVHSINADLAVHPHRMTESPYGDGWIASIRPQALAAELRSSHVAEDAASWMKTELSRFSQFLSERIRLHPAHAAVMADGGEIIEGPLASMDAACWKDFEKSFLS